MTARLAVELGVICSAAALLIAVVTGCSSSTPASAPVPAATAAEPSDTVELCAEEAYGAGMRNMADTKPGATPKKLLIKDLESCDDLPKAQQDQARDIMRGRATRDLLGAVRDTPTPTP